MKNIISFIALILVLYPATLLAELAEPKSVTVRWLMPDTNNIQGYKVYYADNSQMTNRQLVAQTNNPLETELTFELDIGSAVYSVYFTVTAITYEDKELVSPPKQSSIPAPPQNLRISGIFGIFVSPKFTNNDVFKNKVHSFACAYIDIVREPFRFSYYNLHKIV